MAKGYGKKIFKRHFQDYICGVKREKNENINVKR